jgi:hypothetical protein
LRSEISLLCVPTLSCQGEGNTFGQRHQDRELTGDATESQTRWNGSQLSQSRRGTATSFFEASDFAAFEEVVEVTFDKRPMREETRASPVLSRSLFPFRRQ